MEQKIIITLPNGDQLAAEECPHNNGGQIAIGVVHEGIWIQDLAVVETKPDENGNYTEDMYRVFVYADSYDEGYTEMIEIPRVPSDAL